ncbi:hypothetical protein [Gemmatimonas sp.]|uniref:hypothetical protein n=1 Tax=Gemmatimonas sp. TaxID=1962908 RepID=UPI0035653008
MASASVTHRTRFRGRPAGLFRSACVGALLLSPMLAEAQGAFRADSPTDSSADVQAIVATRARSNTAIARHDTVGIAREMMPDATVVSSTSAMSTGAALNVSRMATQFARRPDIKWVRTPERVTVFDAWGVASERRQWVGTWTEPDGPRRGHVVPGPRGDTCGRRRGASQWCSRVTQGRSRH